MHLSPVSYEEFTFYGDISYEISEKMLLEKIIFESICCFTIATEIRFLELDKCNNSQNKISTDNVFSEGMKYA